MRKLFPELYNFFPVTYVLPVEYNEFKSQFARPRLAQTSPTKVQDITFIIKPEASCQGKGIFLTRNPNDVDPSEHYVAQRYLDDPFLIDDLKFDLRIYVLLYGVNPLRVFLFKDGLARFATEPYVKPEQGNIDNLFMHLTNYAINKNSEHFVQNDGDSNQSENDDYNAHKRSLKSLFLDLRLQGYDTKKLKKEIEDIIIKTLITAQPSISHTVKSCQPDDIEN